MTEVTADPRVEDLKTLIERQSDAYGDKTFMTFSDGGRMSFRQFASRVAGFRSHVLDLGIERGARVALMLKNSLFYPVAWLGAISAGAVAVPVNSRLGETDARYILEDSGAVALVVDDSTQDVASAASPASIRATVSARTGDPMEEFESKQTSPGPELHAGDIANIQYTSGTTGFPKGCLLTHRFWQRMGATAVEAMHITDLDTLLTSQSHSYIDPQWNVIAALRSGAHLVLLDGFHPTTFMKEIARFEVTIFYCLGVMPTLLLKQPYADHDTDNALKRVFCSAIPVDQHAEIERRWGVPWIEVFGMTETGVNTGVPLEHGERFVGSGSIGRTMWHVEAAVIDENDRELPPGRIGELALKGLGFMNGYHNNPDATAEFFRNGWAHTGDLVEKDAEGYLYYRGRRKEMIRRAGENISPLEIETALSSHPDVVECAVAPVPDTDLGEEIKAYVVARREGIEPRELADYLGHRLARFKVPRFWEFRASLPHTSSEKIAKADLEKGRADHLVDTVDLRNA